MGRRDSDGKEGTVMGGGDSDGKERTEGTLMRTEETVMGRRGRKGQ